MNASATQSVSLSPNTAALMPVLPLLLVARVGGAVAPAAAALVLRSAYEWGLSAQAGAAIADALAPAAVDAESLSLVFALRGTRTAPGPAHIFARAAEVAASGGAIDRPQAAMLRFLAHALEIADAEGAVLDATGHELPILSHDRVRELLDELLVHREAPTSDECLMGRLPMPTERVVCELPPTIDRATFLGLLAGSISLSKDEKGRIITTLPKLELRQVEELVRIFQEEREKFHALPANHHAQLRTLAVLHAFDWLSLVDDLAAGIVPSAPPKPVAELGADGEGDHAPFCGGLPDEDDDAADDDD